MKSDVWAYHVLIYTPLEFFTNVPKDFVFPKDKLKNLLEETVEKFIRDNYEYTPNQFCYGVSRHCGYYVNETKSELYNDNIQYKHDDPIGYAYEDKVGNIRIHETNEIPQEQIPFRTLDECGKIYDTLREEYKRTHKKKSISEKIKSWWKYCSTKIKTAGI